jgi:methylmalonyl-CoA/ethylmalonyl-CoA epimerase
VSTPRLRVDHIGIAVENLAAARERYEKLLGMSASPVEEVPSEGVRVSFFDLGGCRIELLEAIDAESPVRKFLDKKRSGVHHVSLRVEGDDLGERFSELSRSGVPVLGDGPRTGSAGTSVFFVHPRGADGVLFELSQAGRERRKDATRREEKRGKTRGKKTAMKDAK